MLERTIRPGGFRASNEAAPSQQLFRRFGMAIEFHCPSCQQLFRTPDQAAGKNGKCPHCGAVFPIPAAAGPLVPAGPAPSTPAGPNVADKIEFPCSQCGRAVRTPAAMAGKKGKCPSCGAVFEIPAVKPSLPSRLPTPSRSAASRTSASPPALPARTSAPAASEPSPNVRPSTPATVFTPATGAAPAGPDVFACARCGKTLRMPPGSGGKKGKCPSCGEVFEIPIETSSRAGNVARRPAARQAPVAGLTPLEDFGLTPLDESLEPLGGGRAEADLTSGLTPLDDPFASLGSLPNPFADSLAGGASAAGALGSNPYQSPSLAASGKRTRGGGDFDYVDVLSCTWNTFWDNWASCLLLSLALMGLYLGLAIIVGAVQFGLGLLVRQLPPVPGIIVGVVILVAIFILVVVVGFILQAGLIRIFVNMVRGRPYSIGGLLEEAGYAGKLFGAAILQFLMAMGLGMLMALPIVGLTFLTGSPTVAFIGQLLGFVLNVVVNILLLLTPYLIVDQDRGVLDAISESASAMKDKILVTLGLLLTVALGLLVFVLVTLGLGLLLAGPFMLVLIAAIYARATGQRTAF